MTNDIEHKISALEQKTQLVHAHLNFASRAFVLEFAGTPKSGKSTAVEAVRHFFSRHEFRVHVLAERAAVCPIPMKGHLFFNTWCATSMLAELLANVETDADIIIVDRGILDALVWLRLQFERGELTEEEANVIESFLMLDRWRSLIDLSVVMQVSAQKAMEREIGQRITNRPGSIMNNDVLTAITRSVREATERYGNKFKRVLSIDTSDSQSVRYSNAALAEDIVDQLEEFLNPNVMVIPRAAIEALSFSEGGSFGAGAVNRIEACISQYAKFMRRADAEQQSDYVQIVGAGVLVRDDKVFIFQRKENDPKSTLYGRATIWQGTHVAEKVDCADIALVESALMDRVARSLFLSRRFSAKLRGYCWDSNGEHSAKHFGVIFRIDIDNSHTANDLRKKEYRKGRGRGHDLVGQFIGWSEIESRREELSLESWSKSVLANLPEFGES